MPTISIKYLLALLLAGLFLLFGTSEMVINTRITTQELERNVGQRLQSLAYDMTDKLDHGMFERAHDIEILAELDSFKDSDTSREQQRALLEKLQLTFPAYAWIGFVSPTGQVRVSTGGLLEGASVAQRPWFKGALKGPFAGDVHEAKLLAKLLPAVGNEPLRFVDVATSIRNDQGQVTGVLGAHLSWTWAKEVRDELLQPVQQREHLDVFIIDRAGTVLLGPPSLQGQKLPSRIYQRFPVTGYAIERWPDGRTYVTGVSRSRGYRTYNGLEWRVVVRQDTNIAFAAVDTYRRTAIIMNLALSLLFAGIGFFLASLIARPLTRLRRSAQAIQVGELHTDVPQLKTYAEVAELSGALQELVTRLQDSQLQLTHRVEERTQELQLRTKEAEVLSILSTLSTENRAPREMAEFIAPIIADACDLDWVDLSILDRDRILKTGLYTRSGLAPLPDITMVERLAQEIDHVALVLNRALYIQDYPAQLHALPEFVEAGVQSAAFIPLPGQGGERYVLFTARRIQTLWTDADRRILEAAARSVQISQERRAHLLDLEYVALHDKLTGLGNRRAFDKSLEQAVSAAKRHHNAFGILMVDLDGLKIFNDTEGHERGDALLHEFAQALRTIFRNEDRIFRLGGDEYALILDRAAVLSVESIQERIQETVRLTQQKGFQTVGASAGVAFYPEDATEGPELVRFADQRMYDQKREHHRNNHTD